MTKYDSADESDRGEDSKHVSRRVRSTFRPPQLNWTQV